MIKPTKLFSANACIGYSSSMPPEFENASGLLKHMDRLGIEKALVWHAAARDFDPLWGNQKLSEDIKNEPGAAGRLIPAFTILPTMLYRETAIDELREMLRRDNVKAIRIFTNCAGAKRFTLQQFDPLIGHIEDFNPVILLDIRENISTNDLINLAEKYSQIKFILTKAMWVHLPVVFDLMRRRDNILLETSWLHVMGAIEYIVKEYGPQRIVYGFGNRSHNGASAFALFTSEISEEIKEMIGYKNIEQLIGTGNNEFNISSDFYKQKEKMWNRLDNLASNGTEIIDAHGHLGINGKWAIDIKDYDAQVKTTRKKMEELNISQMIVSSSQALYTDAYEGNNHLEKSLLKYGEQFKGYLSYNPFSADNMAKELDYFFSRDFYIGFKLLCDYWKVPVTDKRFDTVWQYANEHRLPILLHTWTGSYDSPAMLTDIVKKYPDAIFILAHSGGSDIGRYEAEELAMNNSNVYLEWCGSFCSTVKWEETIKKVGNQKIVFGTDSAYHNPAYELGRLLTLDVVDEDIIPILGANMRAIMNQRKNKIRTEQ
jgi:predicted TIM-barrel fold metal-dependent hydrolase